MSHTAAWPQRLLLAAALAAGALAPCDAGAGAPARGFTLLQINDTYKIEGLEAGAVGGLARVRELRRRIEAEGRPVVVVHGGDLLFPSVMSKYLEGEAMIAVLNLLDGSPSRDERLFATFGNHEFDAPDFAVLRRRLEESRFTWLASDLRFRPPGARTAVPFAGFLPNVEAARLIEVGGVRLGLFGLTLEGDPRPWIDYGRFDRRVAAARDAVAALRALGAEFVVAVTHQEMRDDVRLAELVPGIDWIAGGHEHVALERRAGATWITKADADAKTIVRVDVDGAPGGFDARHRFVAASGELGPDAELQGEVARWLVRLAERVVERTGRRLLDAVATTEHALEGVEPAIRGRETALGNFLTDVLGERLDADVALINGGAVRVNDDVPAGGALRVYELEGIFYYDNRPVAIELDGAQLLALLKISVSEASSAHGRFFQVSGLRFRYRVRRDGDDERAELDPDDVAVRERTSGAWEPLALDRRYVVATLDYEWKNGCRDGYPLFSEGCGGSSPPRLERPELSWRGITEEAIARLPGRRIVATLEGRIERIEVSAPGDGR